MTEHAPDVDVKTFGNPPIPVKDVVDEEGNTYCQVHPDVQTGLRCNNCTRLMCAKCAVHTPVGYRCQQCTRQLEDKFFNADTSYYVILFAVCAVGGAIGAFIANLIGFFLFVFFIAAAAGGVTSEAATRFVKGKRGRYAGQVAAAGVVAGAMILAALYAGYFATQFASAVSFTPEQIQQIQETYDAETAREIVQSAQGSFLTYFPSLFIGFLSRLSMLIYIGIAAFTVYGRFNIYGGKR